MTVNHRHKPLAVYFVILVVLCALFIVGARTLGQQGNYLAGLYMVSPAIAAIVTRLFFYKPHFQDAHLRLGRISHYFKFWLLSLGITALSYALYTLLGAVTWDFSGEVFLQRLAQQFAASGQSMQDSLPPGLTPQTMLWIFFVGGLTVFNILPGILFGFGEEFGHRGFMFPLLYRIKPWIGLVGGGLIWYAWHWPLLLVTPPAAEYPLWQTAVSWTVLALGSVCTFIYLAYVYVKSESIWVVSLAHIAMNNAGQSFSYFVAVQHQWLANLGLALTMVIVVAVLYFAKQLDVFKEYFGRKGSYEATSDS
jgi:membrane protease YdiL (CAAX protease family)